LRVYKTNKKEIARQDTPTTTAEQSLVLASIYEVDKKIESHYVELLRVNKHVLKALTKKNQHRTKKCNILGFLLFVIRWNYSTVIEPYKGPDSFDRQTQYIRHLYSLPTALNAITEHPSKNRVYFLLIKPSPLFEESRQFWLQTLSG